MNNKLVDEILAIADMDAYAGKDITFFLESEDAEEVFNELIKDYELHEDDTMREVINVFDYYEYIAITLDDCGFIFVEPFILENGNRISFFGGVYFVPEHLVGFIGENQLDDELNVVPTTTYMTIEEENEDELDEMAYDLVEDILNAKEDECIHCLVKKYLKSVQENA